MDNAGLLDSLSENKDRHHNAQQKQQFLTDINTQIMTKKLFATITLLLVAMHAAFAETEMADAMRSNGKIYVVVVVLATIFAGIFGYLIYIDRKITRLEKENKG
jgi:CcmD family protein